MWAYYCIIEWIYCNMSSMWMFCSNWVLKNIIETLLFYFLLNVLKFNFIYLAASAKHCGTWVSLVVVDGLCCPKTCGISVSQPGIEPMCPALEGRFLTTGLPGTSPTLEDRFLMAGSPGKIFNSNLSFLGLLEYVLSNFFSNT